MTTYERRGGDFLANTTTAANQDGGQVVFLSDGRFVIVWRDSSATGGDTSGTAIRGQIFNADGTRSGGEFLINTTTAGSQNSPALFALPSGGFVVAWTDVPSGTDAEIRAQIFDSAGAKSGGEILANTHVAGVQSGPAGAALADGSFVLTWTDATAEPEIAGTGGSPIGVRSQLFDSAGAKVGAETAVNTGVRHEQSNPAVAALAGGGYVIVWQDFGNLNGIMGQRFASDGTPVGGEFLVSTVVSGTQNDPSIAALAGGGFVVTWTDGSGLGGDTHYTGIKTQIYDSAGAKVGGEFLANADTQGYQQYSFVTATASGGFLVMWSNTTSTVSDGSGSGVKAQYFSAAGVREGGEFWINSTLTNDQFGSSIAAGPEGVIAVYADLSATGGDSSGSSVKFERFIVAPGTAGDDVLTGTDGEDSIHGFDGNDRIDGGGSADELFGDGGDDVLIGGEGDDDLYGAEGADTLTGDLGADLLDGGGGDDDLSGGEGDDDLFAGEGADSLAGGGGADFLNGDGGDDSIDGGEGDDGLAGGDGDDILVAGAGADVLIGGNGDDELDGGEGDDDLYYQYLGASPDHDIAAGGLGIDALFVDFAGIAGAAGVTMTLAADPDGGHSGLMAAGTDYSVAFSSIELFFISATASADQIETGGGNDLILGQGGDDVIVAGAGNDLIVGGTGADAMTGGQGDDRYDVDDAGDTVVENAGEGTDEVQSRLAGYTLADTLENLTGLLATGQVLTGNGGANVIKGNGGNDVIDGGAGADTMQGGAGNDLYHVDNAGDVVSDTAGTDEIRTGLATYSLAGLTFIENLTGTNDAGMTLTGNDSANVIRGAEGADLIRGGLGNDQIFGGGADDRLDGGEGADTMTGGAGNDVYDVDANGDVIVEAADGGIDEAMVDGGVLFILGANVENATAVGGAWHILIGNSLDNVLRGSTGVDELDGRGGDDTMIGGQGWDYYYVDSLGDVIVEEEDVWPVSPGGDTVVTSLADYTLALDLENLRGDSSQQRLVGNDKGNYLSSEGGSDTLIGGKGNDEYGVYAGDVIVELAGEGVDTVIVRAGNWTLSDTLENLTGTSSSGQSLTGNQFANRISGANAGDTIDGAGGADVMIGEGGNDIYYVDEAGDVVTETFNEGIDEVRTALAAYTLGAHVENFLGLSAAGQTVHGNTLSNTMIGGEGGDLFRVETGGADVVRGNGGNDILVFGAALTAQDQADGGLGSDALVLQGNYNLTFTATMVAGIETLLLLSHTDSAFGQASASPFAYRFTSVDSTVAAGATMTVDARWLASAETLNFSGAAETNGRFVLFGGKGADTLTGGAGADFLDGDAGNDVMAGGRGDDVYLVSEFGDSVTELSGEGIDEVRTGLSTYTLGAHLENLVGLAATAQVLRGNALDNSVTGGSGNDLLRLQDGGSDRASGQSGDDVLYFGGSFDSLDVADGGFASDTLALQGNYADLTIGNANVVGIETLLLLGRSDGRYGGAGASANTYRITALTVNAGNGFTVDARSLDSGETVHFDGSAQNAPGFLLYGGAGADILKGGGLTDRLDGGAGADSMHGGKGDDFYFVDNGGDQVVEVANEGTDEVSTALAAYTLAANAERLVGTSSSGQALTGNSLSNVIFGGSGNDVLAGGGGDNDTIYGNDGNDRFLVALAPQVYAIGGAGFDTVVVDYAAATGAVTMFIPIGLHHTGDNGAYMTAGGFVSFSQVERIDITTGHFGDDVQTGAGDDRVVANGGDDVVSVGRGNDFADGGAGIDGISADLEAATTGIAWNLQTNSYSGGVGNFANFEYFGQVWTGSGNDSVVTASGGRDERIYLRAGDDSATVVDGSDYVFGGTGTDTLIIDWSSATTSIRVNSMTFLPDGASGRFSDDEQAREVSFDGIDQFVIKGGQAMDNLFGGQGADRIEGGGGGDYLAGQWGNDILDGGIGDDHLYGGYGDDLFLVDSAGDEVGEDSAAGTDQVRTAIASYTLTANVENLTGTASTGQTLSGNALGNVINAGEGDDLIRLHDGGADRAWGNWGNDVFWFGAEFGAGDSVDGDQGHDEVVLQGGGYASLTLASGMLAGIQVLTLLSAGDNRFGAAAAAGASYSYNITFAADALSPAAYTMDDIWESFVFVIQVDGHRLGAGESLTVDASALGRRAGLIGGGGDDRLTGGSDADGLAGGGGDDVLDGGAGDDSLVDGSGGSDLLRGGAGDDQLLLARAEGAAWGRSTLDGGDGSDLLRISTDASAEAILDAGVGDDRVMLESVTGSAAVTLGGGRDTVELTPHFLLHGNRGATTIADFAAGAGGDSVDWAAALGFKLIGWTPGSNPFGSGHARLVQDGADTLLQISERADGNFATVLRFANRQAGAFTADNFGGWPPPVSGGPGADQISGTASADFIQAGDGNDFVRVQQGGDDRVEGGTGNDVFLFGDALTSADRVDGGTGIDQIALQGDYAGAEALVLGSNIVSVENIALLPGNDTRFGDPGTNFYDYEITSLDVAVAAGVRLVVDANRLRVGEDFTFDGSAETDGSFFIYGGGGVDTLTGGAKNDVFIFGGQNQWGLSDVVTGGAGIDQLALRGNYTIVFGANQLVGIEQIGMVSAQDTRYGALGSSYSYDLTMNDANVVGIQFTVDAAPLWPGETLTFDGSAEDDGSFRVFAGRGNDTIVGSSNGDFIQGNLGLDVLTGGGGADTFRYFAGDSVSGSADHILDLTPGTDRIDLSRIDADTNVAGDQAFRWIGSNAFGANGPASAGELRAFQDPGGSWFVEGDTDGDGAADLVIQLTLAGTVPLGADAFLL